MIYIHLLSILIVILFAPSNVPLWYIAMLVWQAAFFGYFVRGVVEGDE